MTSDLPVREDFHFVQQWYDSATQEHFWMRARLDFLLQAFRRVPLELSKSLRVLDVGSGNGVVRKQLESISEWIIDCADIDRPAIETLPPGRGQNLHYDLLSPRTDLLGQYDVALLLDVLEHVDRPTDFVARAKDHLRPGGVLVINVPAFQFLFGYYDEAAGHLRRYDRETLSNEIRDTGLKIEYMNYWGLSMVPVVLARKHWLGRKHSRDEIIRKGFEPPARWLNSLFYSLLKAEHWGFPMRPFGSSLILIARKEER